jgi:hypothetical protein
MELRSSIERRLDSDTATACKARILLYTAPHKTANKSQHQAANPSNSPVYTPFSVSLRLSSSSGSKRSCLATPSTSQALAILGNDAERRSEATPGNQNNNKHR